MLFNSYVFIFLMLPLSIAGYYLINKFSHKGGQLFLLFGSFFFIGYMNIIYLLILIPSILINYLIGHLINGPCRPDDKRRKQLMITGVVFDVLLLAIFKYSGFFIDNVNSIFKTDFVTINLILPLGISFYTFKQISYLVDYYRDKELSCSILEYALYISFYPQFVQGPITLQSEFIPQLRDESRKTWDSEYASKGLYRFTLGLAKKVIIADTIARAVDGGYGELSEVRAFGALVLILGYTLQIYFDFSGYSDMAVGLGLMFHIDLPENFDSPYKARSIDEFWDRWHITLTRFFTRYVYIPLGGSRKGAVRTYINVFIVFLISGLWHGAEWSFILWGAMHGAAMLISRAIRDVRKTDNRSFPDALKTVIVFVFVNLAWVFFRAWNTAQALDVIKKFAKGGWNGLAEPIYESFGKIVEISWILHLDILKLNDRISGIVVPFILLILTAVCMIAPNSKELTEKWYNRLGNIADSKKTGVAVIASGTAIAILFAWCVISFGGVTEYIYWNF